MVYSLLAIFGYFLYGFGPSVPLLRDDLGVSRAVGALHATAMSVGAVTGGLIGERVVAAIGRRGSLWAGTGLLCVGVVGLCAVRFLGVTLVAAALCSFAGTLILNGVNATLMDRHHRAGPAAITEANAGAGLAGILAPLVVGGAVAVGLGWRAGLLVTLLLAGVAALVFHGVRVPEATEIDPADHPEGVRSLSRQFWLTWALVVCVVGVEFCLSLWSSDLLHTRTGLTQGAATAGFSAVLVGLTVSRFIGGRVAVRREADWILAATRVSLAAGIASGCAPFLLGFAADRVGTHTAFLIVPALIVAAMALLAVSHPGLPRGARRPAPAPAEWPGAA